MAEPNLEPLRDEAAGLRQQLLALLKADLSRDPDLGSQVMGWMWRTGRFDLKEIGNVLEAAGMPEDYWDTDLRQEVRTLGQIVPAGPQMPWHAKEYLA